MKPTATSLYLRTDGSLLLCRGESAIEIPLTPDQLLALSGDALRIAIALDPTICTAIDAVMASAAHVPAAVLPELMQ